MSTTPIPSKHTRNQTSHISFSFKINQESARANGIVTLLGAWASPFSQKAQMALNLKSIDYEFIEQDLSNKSDVLPESNPVHKKIPVLIHNGKPVCESLVIVQYVDEVWTANGPHILPSDPYERANARFWAAYIDDKLYESLRGFLIGVAKAGDGEKTIKTSGEVLAVLEQALIDCGKVKVFFGGDKVGYADIVLGGFFGWIKAIEKLGCLSLIDESSTPRLFKWKQHFSDVDAVKDVLPDDDKMIEVAKAYDAAFL